MEKTYLLPDSVRQPLLEYLVSRPYREVAQAIAQLAQLKPAPQALDDKVET